MYVVQGLDGLQLGSVTVLSKFFLLVSQRNFAFLINGIVQEKQKKNGMQRVGRPSCPSGQAGSIKQVKYSPAVDMQRLSANEMLNSEDTQEQNPQILRYIFTILLFSKGEQKQKDYHNMHTHQN